MAAEISRRGSGPPGWLWPVAPMSWTRRRVPGRPGRAGRTVPRRRVECPPRARNRRRSVAPPRRRRGRPGTAGRRRRPRSQACTVISSTATSAAMLGRHLHRPGHGRPRRTPSARCQASPRSASAPVAMRSRNPCSSREPSPDGCVAVRAPPCAPPHAKATERPPMWSSRSATEYAGQGVGSVSWSSRTPRTSVARAVVVGRRSTCPSAGSGPAGSSRTDRWAGRVGGHPSRSGARSQWVGWASGWAARSRGGVAHGSGWARASAVLSR